MMLPRIRDEEVWKKKGYDSIYDYARILAGMSKNSVDDALWIMDKIANKPELREIAREKGLSAVRPVVAIATEETSQFWAEKASDMSQNTLKTYVRNSRDRVNPSQRVASQDEDMSNGDIKTASIYMKLEVEVIEKLKLIKGDRDWNELMKDLLGDCAEELSKSADGGAEEKPASINTGKRHVPKKIQNYVTRKTSGLCAYPGCSKPYEILHHTKRFALDGAHDPDTIKPLCKAHERLAHGGLIENEELMPVDWAMRKQPDINNPKYAVDKKVNEYYMPKLE